MIEDIRFDQGRPFDWGRTSKNYAKYRDIYPETFFKHILKRNIGLPGQKILDVGTGTGVLPRHMFSFGADWTGADISEAQIIEAERLSGEGGMKIPFVVSSAENLDFPDESFDAITACQCFWYFDHEKTTQVFSKLLKKDGRLVFLMMAWLPGEDIIAYETEKLVLKHNPSWTSGGETRHLISIPEEVLKQFEVVYEDTFLLNVPFTRSSWNGRIKACRGIGASLSDASIAVWEKEHVALLDRIAPEHFDVLHYAAITEMKLKS
ncbi:MAG: class I SAM-dependent methyltransferase [Clostridiaceae bacterium]|nr:class I SAM-dependent methyltransferase [Clostridiaceae bacterium]